LGKVRHVEEKVDLIHFGDMGKCEMDETLKAKDGTPKHVKCMTGLSKTSVLSSTGFLGIPMGGNLFFLYGFIPSVGV
jgi:hypothetical protein